MEVCAEPGEFVYDTSTEPSIFTGNLGESIRETFRTVGKRFTFGGDTEYTEHEFYMAKRAGSIQYAHIPAESNIKITHSTYTYALYPVWLLNTTWLGKILLCISLTNRAM